MQVIEFTVRNQRLSRYTSGIVASNSYKYLKFKMNFHTDDWSSAGIRVANFSYRGHNYPIELDENNQCYVPKEVLHTPEFKVSVYGGGITTNTVRVPVEDSGLYDNYEQPSYNELINRLSAMIDDLEETKADNIVYNEADNTIQLEANGMPIGEAVEACDCDEVGGNGGVYVPNVTEDNMLEFTLQDAPTKDYYEFDIDKNNDWSEDDSAGDTSNNSNYIWEDE